MTRRIRGLSEIAGDFDAMLIDQFGVIHDGQHLYPGQRRRSPNCMRAAFPSSS